MSTIELTKQILKGTYNNLLNKEQELFKARMIICKSCKLYKEDGVFGAECNPKLYLNPETDETSFKPKEGYIHGCGCILRSKTRVIDTKCPVGKW